MRIRYSANALRQLERILDYIDERSPKGARRVKERIQAVIGVLADHPMAGEITDRPGQRRMVASPYPYAIFYRVRDDEVVVQRIRHTARRPV